LNRLERLAHLGVWLLGRLTYLGRLAVCLKSIKSVFVITKYPQVCGSYLFIIYFLNIYYILMNNL